MAYYSLPKIKTPQPQVPLRVANNRQRFSDTLQQRQGFIDQRKQDIQSSYVLNKLLTEPLPMPMGTTGLPPPVMGGVGMPTRLPGFADGGDVDTFGGNGESEDERREREARQAAEAGAAAGQFMGRGYMGGLGNFAPPPALPGAPIYGPAGVVPPPTREENIQTLYQQRPELSNIAQGEAQANDVAANLAQMRDYLPGNEKGPWYGPTTSPAQAQQGVQQELGPGLGGAIKDLAGQGIEAGLNSPALNLLPGGSFASPILNAAGVNQPSIAEAYNTEIPVVSDLARAVQPYAEQAGATAARSMDPLGIHGRILDAVGAPTPSDVGGYLGRNAVPVTAGDWALNLIGAKGPVEAITGLPVDDAARALMGRVGAGAAERLPGIRAGLSEAITGGERGSFQWGNGRWNLVPDAAPAAQAAPGVGNVTRPGDVAMEGNLGRYLDEDPNAALIQAMRNAVGGERVLRESRLGETLQLPSQTLSRNLPDVMEMGPRTQPYPVTPPAPPGSVSGYFQPAPEGTQGGLRGIGAPPLAPMPPAQPQGQFPSGLLPGIREPIGTPPTNLIDPRQAPLPEVGAGALQPNLRAPGATQPALGGIGAPPPSAAPPVSRLGQGEFPGLPGVREPLPTPASNVLPGQLGLPQPPAAPPLGDQRFLPGDAGAASDRISQWMREAQDLVEPKPLPIDPRTAAPAGSSAMPPAAPPREPLPSERMAAGAAAGATPAAAPNAPSAAWTAPDPAGLRLTDPEKYQVAQLWARDQGANPPSRGMDISELQARLYNAGIEVETGTPWGEVRALYDRADGMGIKLPIDEPPIDLPDAFDLARRGATPQGQAAAGAQLPPDSVRNLSLDEAEEQAARLGVPFDRQAIERGTQLTKDQEWGRLQQATDDFLEKERIANTPEAKAAEADYVQRLHQEQQAPDPKAAPVAPPEGFPAHVNTPAAQRAYNTIAYAAYWSLGGDIGTILRQDVLSMLNIFNVPQSLEALKLTAEMRTTAGAAKVLDGLDARVAEKMKELGDKAKVNLHRPEVPGHRVGDSGRGMESRELTQSPGLNRIPGIGKYYEATSVMNSGLLYARRSLEFERFVDNLADRRFVLGLGNQVNSPLAKQHVVQSYMNQVAVMGGRANLQYGGLKLAPLLSHAGPLFTSLRFMMSVPERIPYLLPINRIAEGHWEVMGPQWREAARQHAGYGLALAGILGGAGAAGADVDWESGSFKFAGMPTVNLTGGVSKYWDAIQNAADGNWMKLAEFARNKTGPIPEDLIVGIQAAGLDKATGTEDLFKFMRPERWDTGFTGQAKRETPGLNWNTADRAAAMLLPLWAGSMVKAYNNAKAQGDNPFANAAATAVGEFFGADVKTFAPGVLTQLRTNVKNDEALDPVIRGQDFNKLGPDGQAAVNKLAEASQPEDYKAARKEADERNPVFAQHREAKDAINAELNQRKTDLYERFRTGDISGRAMTDGRKVANEVAREKKQEAYNDPKFQKALKELPEQNEVNKALNVYNGIISHHIDAKGKIDWDAVTEKQNDFIRYVGQHDRETANLLLYEINTKAETANPLDRLMEVAQPTLSHYLGDLKDQPIQKGNELRANPRDDAMLNLLGYAQKTQTPEAAGILKQMREALPNGRDFKPASAASAAPVASAKPAPAAAPAPQQMAAPISDHVFPVQGYGGKVDLHWGTDKGAADLFAARGTPVLAMSGGTVTNVATTGLGGNNVTIHGNDGRDYYYAHGDRAPQVQMGQVIPTGQFLFGVGDSGNAAGKGTHLHLGIGNGIVSGSGPTGGSGRDFDATALLQSVLGGGQAAPPAGGGRGMSAPIPAQANTGGTDKASLQAYATQAAENKGISPEVFKGLIGHESSWNPQAVNKTSGAAGLGQFLPSTAKGYGATPEQLRNDPHRALDLSAQMLADLKNTFRGDERKAVASYFVGQGNVSKAVQQGGANWLDELDRIARQYNQGSVSTYLRAVGAL